MSQASKYINKFLEDVKSKQMDLFQDPKQDDYKYSYIPYISTKLPADYERVWDGVVQEGDWYIELFESGKISIDKCHGLIGGTILDGWKLNSSAKIQIYRKPS
jgi:hypothetical protein